jgi:ribosomal protein S18 acetylase RimI-like enzyme
MSEADLPAVAEVDSAGFAQLWKNSLTTLRFGFLQAGFATVAQINDEIVGYQISTRNSFGVHLARLAVFPQQQRHGIGYYLVQDLLNQARLAGLHRLTVNTQNDNQASLALYQKMGFVLTGERYTVFTCQL